MGKELIGSEHHLGHNCSFVLSYSESVFFVNGMLKKTHMMDKECCMVLKLKFMGCVIEYDERGGFHLHINR